ncbi:hypothetical protein Vau01_098110 [Virgisporangium aurantiacum]|uniref:Uncharacterized protein n=2 Tax=Virgisporangium aurantiacum TaxID=175570 RepID=A0A8J3ZI28_9ACTN|nr:hypothetical protein Vau01_098110 [Virgisporangium aurantiacum]
MPTAAILVFVAVLGVVAGSAGHNSRFHAGIASGPGATAYDIRVPLRYAPTWLPPGIVERERGVASARSLSGGPVNSFTYWRAWQSPTARPWDGSLSVSMSVSVDSRDRGDCPHGENVAINDVPGKYNFALGQAGPASCLTWHPDPHTALQINGNGLGLSRDDMLRIARSVRADSTPLVVPFRVVDVGGFAQAPASTRCGNDPAARGAVSTAPRSAFTRLASTL